MREQDRTLECEHSIYGFHKQVNLGERTWNDDLRAMSYSLGIAIVVLVAEQNVILQTSLFTAGMLRSQQPRRRAAELRYKGAASHVWMAPAWQEEMQRAAQKSLAVMCPACSRSPDGLLALMESANRGLITRAGSMSQ